MLNRLLLVSVISLSLSACFWDDFKKSSSGTVSEPPVNRNETLPNNGVVVNGNLEESETEATGWSAFVDETASATYGLSKAQYYSGSTSYKVSIASVGVEPAAIAIGPEGIALTEGYTYYFSAWALGTNGATANFVAQTDDEAATVLASQQMDITSIWRKVSFSFLATPGVTTVKLPVELSYVQNIDADIYFDNVSLIGVAPSGSVVVIPIEEGLAGWSSDQATNTLTFDAGSNALLIEPDWANNDQVAMFIMDEPVDFTGVEIEFIVDIPQEYIDASISVQPYIQQNSGNYDGDYSGFVGFGDLKAGISTLKYTPSSPPVDAQRIGFQVKGAGRSADPTSAISVLRISYKGGDGGSDLDLTQGWDWSGGEPTYDGGVSYSPTAEDEGLFYNINGPDDLEGATIEFTIKVDQAFLDSGANLQPIAQQNFGSYDGEYGCWINNADLSTTAKKFPCRLDETGAPFNIADGESIKVGVQPKSSTPAGTVTITDVQIKYASLPVDANWRTSSGSPSYSDGVSYSPTAEGDNLLYDVDGPDNFEGATFIFTIEASQEFIDSGANLQPFAQAKIDNYPGEWSCWINNADLKVAGADHPCILQTADFNLADDVGMQIGVQVPTGATPAGTIKITAVRIIYAD